MGKRFCENNGTTFVPKKPHADLHLHSANSLKEANMHIKPFGMKVI
jgi:hypothetical protein